MTTNPKMYSHAWFSTGVVMTLRNRVSGSRVATTAA
jgi:hypothetical protein